MPPSMKLKKWRYDQRNVWTDDLNIRTEDIVNIPQNKGNYFEQATNQIKSKARKWIVIIGQAQVLQHHADNKDAIKCLK